MTLINAYKPLLWLALLSLLTACANTGPLPPVFQGGVKEAPAKSNTVNRNAGIVVVGTTDTLYSIARRNKVPLRSLIDVNGLKPPYRLQVGQRLRLPLAATYTVKSGDTVYRIARETGVDMNALVSLNGLRDPYLIRVGDVLRLPRSNRTVSSNTGTAPASTTTGSTRIAASDLPTGLRILPQRKGLTAAQMQRFPRPLVSPADLKPRSSGVTIARQQPAVQPAASSSPAVSVPAGRFLWPVEGRVISRFGAKQGGFHNDGINIVAPKGAPVRSAADGTVVFVRPDMRGFGQIVLIRHNGGWVTAYAHNQAILVEKGQNVRAGQVIARVGASGGVDKPQLHFEVRKGSRPVNPQKYLLPRGPAVSIAPVTRLFNPV